MEIYNLYYSLEEKYNICVSHSGDYEYYCLLGM
jgi:hypothetical protein